MVNIPIGERSVCQRPVRIIAIVLAIGMITSVVRLIGMAWLIDVIVVQTVITRMMTCCLLAWVSVRVSSRTPGRELSGRCVRVTRSSTSLFYIPLIERQGELWVLILEILKYIPLFLKIFPHKLC